MVANVATRPSVYSRSRKRFSNCIEPLLSVNFDQHFWCKWYRFSKETNSLHTAEYDDNPPYLCLRGCFFVARTSNLDPTDGRLSQSPDWHTVLVINKDGHSDTNNTIGREPITNKWSLQFTTRRMVAKSKEKEREFEGTWNCQQ
jgi:hypothetical protein